MDGSAMPDGWCLRFLGGGLKGRSIALKPGANLVGSAGECEVMLPGGDVQPRHLVFNVGELVVSLQRVGTAAARINGQEMQQPRRSVVPGDVISLGRFDLQLERSYPAPEQDDRMFAPPAASPAAQEAAAAEPVRSRRHHVLGGALAATAVIGLLVLAIFGARLDGSAQANAPVDIAQVEKALAGFQELEIVAGAHGQVSVKGFVESRLRRQALADAVAPFGPRVLVNVHTTEDMVEQARRFIGAPGVAVSYTGQGRLVLTGSAEDDVKLKVRRLAEDLHPTVIVSDRLQYRPNERRAARGGDPWTQYQDVLPSRMVGITDNGDGLRHIQLANGTRYFEGAVLKSGAAIERIDPGGPVITGAAQPEASPPP